MSLQRGHVQADPGGHLQEEALHRMVPRWSVQVKVVVESGHTRVRISQVSVARTPPRLMNLPTTAVTTVEL